METAESWLVDTWLVRSRLPRTLQSPHNTSYLTITVTNIDLPTETGRGLSRNRSVIF